MQKQNNYANIKVTPEKEMFYTSEDFKRNRANLTNQIYQFMVGLYPNLEKVDIEVIPTDLTSDNVFGWTLENNDQNEIEIHYDLEDDDFITTLIHELVHVDQNVRGLLDDTERENEAYKLEIPLTNQFLNEC